MLHPQLELLVSLLESIGPEPWYLEPQPASCSAASLQVVPVSSLVARRLIRQQTLEL